MIATLAVTLTGCSRNPVAPTVDTTAAQGGAGGAAVSFDPVEPAPIEGGGTPNAQTVALSPNSEAVITVGRFTLWLRKNSLKSNAQVTLRVHDAEALEVELVVSPAGTTLKSPAILTANMSDVADFDYATGTMLQWNGSWQPIVDAAGHPNQENVVAHVDQFANCKVVSNGGAGGAMNKSGL